MVSLSINDLNINVCIYIFIGVLDAFSAYVNNGLIGLTTFSNVLVSNSDFNGSTMSVHTKGLYWMHISVTVPAFTQANVTLSGTSNYMRIIQSHGNFDHPDTLSRNGLMDLQAGTQLTFLSKYPSQSLQWTSFRLNNIMSQLIAFQVAKSSPAQCCGLVTFDLVLLNIGFAWNIGRNVFIAPKNGQYFFSVSAGCYANSTFDLFLVLNSDTVQKTQNGASSKFFSGIDLHSTSKLLQFNEGDTFVTIVDSKNLYSDATNLQISFAGFYYSPTISSAVSALLYSLCLVSNICH